MSQILDAQDLKAKLQELLDKTPGEMTAVLGRKLGVTELEVLRHWPRESESTELDPARIEALIKELDKLGRVHVIASNEGCVLEAYGSFGGFSVTGPFLNVQTDSLDMHIKRHELAAVMALIKPSHQDGQTTYSFQFFTRSGVAGFKVFLYKSVTEQGAGSIDEKIGVWDELRRQYAKAAGA